MAASSEKKRIFTFVKGESAGASNMKLLVRGREGQREREDTER